MPPSRRPPPSPRRAFGPRAGALAAALLALALAPRTAGADGLPPAAAPIDEPSRRIELAKDLFHEGVARLKAGDVAGALDLFLRSRGLVPSYQNTKNAAVCLYRLGRTVEALEMYEELLDRFQGELEPEEQRAVEAVVAALRGEIGTLEVTSSTGGRLFIDGQPRAELPLAAPLRVPRGEHAIRVEKEGHEPFEITVEVLPGAPIALKAALRPLPPRPSAPGAKPPTAGAPPPERPPPPPLEGIRGGWFLEAYGGYVAGATLGSDAERDAGPTCGDDCPAVGGSLVGLRGGYLFDLGLALELGGGSMALSSTFQRTRSARFGSTPLYTVNYRLADEVLLRASFLSAGASYRAPIGAHAGVLARLSAGLASARSGDSLRATAAIPDGDPVPAVVTGRDKVLPSTLVFFLPEVGVEAAWGGLRVGALLGVAVLASTGPRFGGRQAGITPDCHAPGSVGCAPNATVTGSERSYGPVQLWVPQLAVGYTF